jgi:glycosyltransferase involved in cell wall biosynthesis
VTGPAISVVIPAYQEADRIRSTVRATLEGLAAQGDVEALVVDDGSSDATSERAEAAGARVLRLPRNRGKGAALAAGLSEGRGDILMMLDADLGETACEAPKLLIPILSGDADMSVATFTRVPGHKGGFGLVMRLARWGLRKAGGAPMAAPLSGQRAFTRAAWERIGRLDGGFGPEMGLNLDALRLGLEVVEVETGMAHRLTGRDLAGFRHRARQFWDVALAIARRWPLRSAR